MLSIKNLILKTVLVRGLHSIQGKEGNICSLETPNARGYCIELEGEYPLPGRIGEANCAATSLC
jgi:hypothetical protein